VIGGVVLIAIVVSSEEPYDIRQISRHDGLDVGDLSHGVFDFVLTLLLVSVFDHGRLQRYLESLELFVCGLLCAQIWRLVDCLKDGALAALGYESGHVIDLLDRVQP